ncbi:sensor histidine kinase [Streptacidiphilus sp. PB12-B1b]|uniref:sensor histidine kinase n=1 Tax=Streptacidiphilus sp. PB12-B1b TaxID=2705012 RepID=UPI0015F97297|nr:sensor histidine kinase [Streptacidiphilus sp. PB12-B1b]QMU79560.1 sensor histidine kinase [Streptacidiphilus sp. PB12-B1b]
MQTMYSWLRRHPTVADAAWAALLFLLCALEVAVDWDQGQHDLALAGCTVVLCAMLVIRRRRPDVAVLVGIGVGLGQVVVGSPVNFADLALLVLAYTGAAFAHVWTSRIALVAGLAAGPLAWLRFYSAQAAADRPAGTTHSWTDAAMSAVFSTPFVLCWVLGRLTRIRRAYYVQLEDRAERLERERDAQAKIAVAAERARIARELHDVVAHNVSVMIVQADGASFVMDSSPEQARQALATIAGTGRQALEEMRRLLGLLRSADSGGDYVPQPGVEQLPDLLEQVRNAGLPVAFEVEGEPRELPRGLELTAYRIVQEALTNARKHGGPRTAATVRLRFDDRGVDVLIEDDGRGASAELARGGGADGFGHGLIGMRERVGMVGGTLAAGPRADGGFRIDARLPLKPTRTPAAAPAPAPAPPVAVPVAPPAPAADLSGDSRAS